MEWVGEEDPVRDVLCRRRRYSLDLLVRQETHYGGSKVVVTSGISELVDVRLDSKFVGHWSGLQ